MGLFDLGLHDELTGKIMIVMLFLVFLVVTFVIFLHLYAKWYLLHSPAANSNTASSSSPSILDVHLGLDPKVLESIPVLSFLEEEHEKGIECAVCLSELSEGENFRLLPKCHHGFHVECIDMWFASHPTCPLCRNSVKAENNSDMLFEGNEVNISIGTTANVNEEEEEDSSAIPSNGTVAIDMPSQVVVEEEEGDGIMATQARSLKSLLSRDKRVINSCSTSSHATQL